MSDFAKHELVINAGETIGSASDIGIVLGQSQRSGSQIVLSLDVTGSALRALTAAGALLMTPASCGLRLLTK